MKTQDLPEKVREWVRGVIDPDAYDDNFRWLVCTALEEADDQFEIEYALSRLLLEQMDVWQSGCCELRNINNTFERPPKLSRVID